MIPSIELAKKELESARDLNPGAWVKHSENVALAAKLIANACNLDEEKAYVLGLLHDIGRRNGVSAVKHTIDGYHYAMSNGWDDVASVCLTHSYPTKNIYEDIGKMDIDEIEKNEIEKFILEHEYTDYDKLIILCDALALPNRLCVLEQRLVDTTRRYGIFPFTIARWNATFEIKEYFESLAGKSIYSIIPQIKLDLK